MKITIIKLLLGLIITTIGLFLVYQFGGFKLLVGIFLVLWGNNIQQDINFKR